MKKLLFKLCLLLLCSPAWAWNSNGHMVIGQIAYDNLQPKAREQVQELIERLAVDYPGSGSLVRASVWADWIKAHGVNAFSHWHYIDLGFSEDGTPYPAQPETGNVVWAINQSLKVLANPRSNDFEKAFFLRLLVHFVGDIHQPLHCANRYSQLYPNGDAGGNRFKVIAPYGKNLHQAWDQGLGLLKSPKGQQLFTSAQVKQLAAKIETRYPRKQFAEALQQKCSRQWAYEGYVLSKTNIYPSTEEAILDQQYQEQLELKMVVLHLLNQ